MPTESNHNNNNNNQTRRNRSDFDIFADMLTSALEGDKKTHIMYRSRLSVDQLKAHLPLLLEVGLLSFDEKTKKYKTSKAGRDFLRKYKSLKI